MSRVYNAGPKQFIIPVEEPTFYKLDCIEFVGNTLVFKFKLKGKHITATVPTKRRLAGLMKGFYFVDLLYGGVPSREKWSGFLLNGVRVRIPNLGLMDISMNVFALTLLHDDNADLLTIKRGR